MEPILTVDGLSISFTQYDGLLHQHRLSVIRDLSLTVAPGQVVAVLGASGSGKSLLAHGILGLLPANSHMDGQILYDGEPLTPARAADLRGHEISLVPQGAGYLDPLMQVGPQLCKGQRTLRDKCRRVLARYGLGPETESLYPFELSGGMSRRVMIATAVLDAPRLIVADEPTPGLDRAAAQRILGHFRALAEEGTAILFITHDLDLALEAADRIVVLYAGETVEEAAAEDFQEVSRLRHPYTRALWHAMPQHGFVPLAGTQPYPGDGTVGCRFAPRCPHARPACRESIPYRTVRGGRVRCLDDLPEGGNV